MMATATRNNTTIPAITNTAVLPNGLLVTTLVDTVGPVVAGDSVVTTGPVSFYNVTLLQEQY